MINKVFTTLSAFCFAVLLAFSLAACSTTPIQPNSTESNSTQSKKISLSPIHLLKRSNDTRKGLSKLALNDLLAEADQALSRGPYSVASNAYTAPSRNVNDYFSQAPYWWPNPETESGLPFVRRDGERFPESNKSDNDRRQMMAMSQDVQTLSIAYHFTNDDKYAEHAAVLLRTWFIGSQTKMNPHLDYGQGIPGVADGRNFGIIETANLIRVVQNAPLLDSYIGWRKRDHEALKEWFATYLTWLETSQLGIRENHWHNNHGTFYDAQRIAFAIFSDQYQKAREIAESVKTVRIKQHIAHNGAQPHELDRTLSLHYSVYNLRGFFMIAKMSEQLGVDIWRYKNEKGAGLQEALDFIVPYIGDLTAWPHPQIKPIKKEIFLGLLRDANDTYTASSYGTLIQRHYTQQQRSTFKGELKLLF